MTTRLTKSGKRPDLPSKMKRTYPYRPQPDGSNLLFDLLFAVGIIATLVIFYAAK
jgi:hypothetical protein